MKTSVSPGDHRILLKSASIALLFPLVCCFSGSKQPPLPPPQDILTGDVAPGVILMDLLESGHPEHYWQYEVRPTTGSVRQVKEETFRDYAHENLPHVFLQPAGAIGACSGDTKASSPDAKFEAYCTGSDWAFFVADKRSHAIVYTWKPREWRGIRGFGWAANSHSVAILNVSSYYGKTPLELLSGVAGHPVPHDTIFLDVLDVRSGKTTEYLIRNNVPYSFTRILSWTD